MLDQTNPLANLIVEVELRQEVKNIKIDKLYKKLQDNIRLQHIGDQYLVALAEHEKHLLSLSRKIEKCFQAHHHYKCNCVPDHKMKLLDVQFGIDRHISL